MAQEAIPFDTHRFVQNLVASGFTETQAEALASEQINLLNSNLATKSDIAAVLAEVNSLKSDVEILRISTQSDIEALRLSTRSDIEALRLSTRSDIEALRLSTKSDIEAFQLSTEAKIERAKYDMVKWMIGAMVAQSAIIISLSVTLSKLL
ncbi:MAG: DUF1640 domain-containing protein [Chloroflexota bacterium]|nr:DUF1640 domain-containing protein [Chloroflexota bacterium]